MCSDLLGASGDLLAAYLLALRLAAATRRGAPALEIVDRALRLNGGRSTTLQRLHDGGHPSTACAVP